MSYVVTFAGKSNLDVGLLVYQRPNIRTPEEQIDTYKIPGRDMNLIERSGTYDPVKIDVTFNYASGSADTWGQIHREAVQWLRSDGELSFSDDPDVFWKVLYVNIEENKRTLRRVGKFTATFVCKPGIYFRSGAEFVDIAEIASQGEDNEYFLENNYSESRPVYQITGNGAWVLTVNGKSMTAAVTNLLRIDTARKIAYRSATEVTNTAVSGDYDDLVLVPGINHILLEGSGTLQVQTNFRVL